MPDGDTVERHSRVDEQVDRDSRGTEVTECCHLARAMQEGESTNRSPRGKKDAWDRYRARTGLVYLEAESPSLQCGKKHPVYWPLIQTHLESGQRNRHRNHQAADMVLRKP